MALMDHHTRKSDNSLLAQFYFVDEDLNLVASELDSFDGRKDPERCTMLVNQLRVCQDKVLQVIQKIMDDAIGSHRANRDFRVKFPDDVLQDSLSGQLWFGAECLAAGSSILNREVESASMRPLARALTKNLDSLRNVLREQCLKSVTEYTDRIREALTIFDKLFAEFELSYVSAMVPVKTMKEYDMLQEVTVLFSETVQRALTEGLLTQDMLDDYDPALMFTIPRLAIVCGLLVYPEGPLNPDMDPTNMTEMFRPFQTLLFKIRELLYTLNIDELCTLEKSLCSNEEPELSKTPLAGQGLENLQIDQGFDEGGEGIVSLDILASDILMSTTSSSSPRTPVNTEPEFTGLDSLSTTSTIMDAGFRFSSSSGLNLMDSGDSFAGLNKSESQDSGLHSENISTSDSVTIDVSPSATHHDLNAAANTTEVQSINKPINSSKRSPDSSRKTASIHPIESISEHIHDSEINDSNFCDNSKASDRHEEKEEVSRLTEEEGCVNSASIVRKDAPTHEEVRHFCQMLVQGIIEEAIRQYRGASVNNCDNGSINALNEGSENICEVSNPVENKEQTTEGISCEMKADASNCDTESINAISEGSVKVTSPINESANSLSEDGVLVPTQENGSVNSSNEGGVIVSTPDNGSVNAQNEKGVTVTTNGESNCDLDVNADQPAPDQTGVETETRAAVGLSRQFSWQYNIQLASHNYSLLEAAGSERSLSADGGSISSDSTLSDQGTQDSVTDFVVETLSAMNRPRTLGSGNTNPTRSVGNSATSKPCGSDVPSEPQGLEATLLYKDKDNEADSKNYKNISNRTKQILMKKNVTPSTDESVAMATNATNSIIPARSAADSPKYISKSQLGNKTVKQKGKVRKDRRESLEHINCKTGPQASTSSEPLDLPVIKALRDEDSSSYSSCQSTSSECSRDKDCSESETSSCTSENNDEEEIALAIEAAELASRNEARSRFRSSSDLIHRLFVCIAGVADQLQTNYASDLRHILKCVFELNSTNMEEPEITPEPVVTPTEQVNTDIISSEGSVNNSTSGVGVTPQQGQVTSQQGQQGSTTGLVSQQQGQGSTIRPTSNQNTQRSQPSNRRIFDEPPEWEPDSLVERCTSCKTPFTFVRRRHHCRNCGKIFCGKCSSTTVPLPQYGHQKPVRVCHNCFIYQIAHFTMQ